MKTLYLLLTAIIFIGCSRGDNLDSFVNQGFDKINSRDFHGLWKTVSSESKASVATQLENNKKSQAGIGLIASILGIPASKVSSLTTEEYFVAIMEADKTEGIGVVKIRVAKIEDFGNSAVVHWVKGENKGSSKIVKENGRWYVQLDSVAGQ